MSKDKIDKDLVEAYSDTTAELEQDYMFPEVLFLDKDGKETIVVAFKDIKCIRHVDRTVYVFVKDDKCHTMRMSVSEFSSCVAKFNGWLSNNKATTEPGYKLTDVLCIEPTDATLKVDSVVFPCNTITSILYGDSEMSIGFKDGATNTIPIDIEQFNRHVITFDNYLANHKEAAQPIEIEGVVTNHDKMFAVGDENPINGK
ncbi:unnamed protein product, partial [marine sediment metagenome]